MANQQPDADSEIEQNQPQPNNPRAVPINSAELRKNVNAYRTLRGAVGKQVQKDAGGIAAALVESVKAGNSNSARIVVSLIDKRKPRKIKTRTKAKRNKALEKQTPKRSVAMDLAAEPPYTGPDEDGEVPDFFGT